VIPFRPPAGYRVCPLHRLRRGDPAGGFTRRGVRTTRVDALILIHGWRSTRVFQIEVFPESLMPKLFLPCADQGVRSRSIILEEQVVITDVEGDDFSVRFVIAKRLTPCLIFSFDTADEIVEF